MAARPQRGVALITAILVVALTSTVAVSLASRQHLDIRRTGNVIQTDQAFLYTLGLEDLGARFLSEYAQQQKYDAEADLAKATVAYPVEGGMVQGHLQDMNGRFNLNSLVDSAGEVNQKQYQRFQRLLGLLNLNFELADAVVDWIDPNSDVRFGGGAEDNDYLSEERPYRAANRYMASPTELAMVNGFTQEILYGSEEQEALLPHVTALPEGATTINPNTATDKVLQALSSVVDASVASQIIEDRAEEPFEDVSTFMNHAAIQGALSAISEPQQKTQATSDLGYALDVQSSYFLVNGNVSLGHNTLQMSSLLYRTTDGRKVVPVARAIGMSGMY